jgi:hypothetical protein
MNLFKYWIRQPRSFHLGFGMLLGSTAITLILMALGQEAPFPFMTIVGVILIVYSQGRKS